MPNLFRLIVFTIASESMIIGGFGGSLGVVLVTHSVTQTVFCVTP